MIIQKLHIHNIASIIDATIDFTAQPLADSDVYLITGDTGAGKTTILDCICLALFNNTPRLSKGKNITVTTDKDDLTLKDPRRLMRRKTGEAQVELWFSAHGKDYKAEWQVQRGTKKKLTTSIDNITRSFYNLTDKSSITGVGTKDTELQNMIQGVVGLDFDQFCRTTMLAQNEFTKFLASDENERAAILEKITQTAEFSKAGSKIYEITQQKAKDWQTAKEKASDTGLSAADIAQKKQEIAVQQKLAGKKMAERDNANAKKTWLQTEAQLKKSEEEALTVYEKAQQALQSEEYQSQNLFVEQWNQTIEARQWLKELVEANNALQAQNEALSDQKSAFKRVLNGQQFNQDELARIQKEQTDVDNYLTANEAKAETFDKEQTIAGHLTTLIAKRAKIKELTQALESLQKQHDNTLVPNQNTAGKDFQEAENAKKMLADQIRQKEQQVNELDLKKLRADRDKVKELLHDIQTAITDVEGIKTAENTHQDEDLRLQKELNRINELKNKLKDEITPRYDQAKQAKENAEKESNALRDSVDKFAKQLRSRLTVGCTCPVCRQKVQALPLTDDLEQIYKTANEESEKAKKAFEKVESEKNQAESDINVSTQKYQQDKQKFDADQSVQKAKDKAIASCKKCGIVTVDANTKKILTDKQEERSKYLSVTLEPQIKSGEDIENKLKNLRDKQTEQEGILEANRKKKEAADKQVQDCQKKIDLNNNSIADNQKEEGNAQKGLESLVANQDWLNDWKTAPDLFQKELKEAAATYQQKKNRKTQLEAEAATKRALCEQTAGIIDQICSKQTEWSSLTANQPCELRTLSNAASDVLVKVGEIGTKLSQASETKNARTQSLQDFYAVHPKLNDARLQELDEVSSVAGLQTELEQMRQEPGKKEALWETAKENHQKHQSGNKPVLAEEDTVESCEAAAKAAGDAMDACNQQIGALQKELNDDTAKKQGLGALIAKAEEAEKVYNKWNNLNELLGDKDGKVFRKIAQSLIFNDLLHSANEYLKKLEPRYTLKAVPGSLFSSLEDAYQGFASRDTGSLSGGESFLVSLALALALSDIGQGLSVDTLFIDEGFGSLSGLPLTNAINTLRSLHNKNGRHVGIISHIQEVRENIPVQIQVNKSIGSSSSTIEVVGQNY